MRCSQPFQRTSKPIIELDRVTKYYAIYNSPFHRLKEVFTKRNYHQIHCALHEVTLRVYPGEGVGIIGDNGAGKSTLLQIVAGTITPSSGSVKRRGNVLAILELGIGFHPELSGIENIFNYARLLGYSEGKIKRVLPEIIEFAELGDFVKCPVKTYSSGMLMRLAFSLIVHLNPDVLVIDEALSVGDVGFQKKCIDYILNYRKCGGTLLFCSHALYQVSRISDRVIWLDKGRVRMEGNPEEVISAYEWYVLKREREAENNRRQEKGNLSSNNIVKVEKFYIQNRPPIKRGDDISFVVKVAAIRDNVAYHVALSIKVPTGWGVFVAATHFDNMKALRGDKIIRIKFPKVPLLGGYYYAVVRILDNSGMVLFDQKEIGPFYIERTHGEIGTCYLPHHWEIT